jgi:chromosome segregation ATPase
MALRAGTRTVIKSVSDRFNNLKREVTYNNSSRLVLRMRERSARAERENAEEELAGLATLKSASELRLRMFRLQLEEAELDNNADRIVEATAMFETAQQEHDHIEEQYEILESTRDAADARLQDINNQYNNVVEELYELCPAQEYIKHTNEYYDLSKTVSDKRRDAQLANEFNSSVNMQ